MSIYLYLKQHNTTGLKYLGQTIRDPFVYKGSGTRWINHIKKHGYDVTTIVLYETPYMEEIREMGLYYSDLWNIVKSKEFANLIQERGEGVRSTEETKAKIRAALKGRTLSDEHKAKISASKKGKTHTIESKKKMSNKLRGKTLSDEHKAKIAAKQKGRTLSDETRYKMRTARLMWLREN